MAVDKARCMLIRSLQANYHSPIGCLNVFKPGQSQSLCTHLRSFFYGSLRRAICVKMSQDIYSDSRRPLNLTQLRKNKQKKHDKTGGRKCPRTLDVGVVAAGDMGDGDLERVRTLS